MRNLVLTVSIFLVSTYSVPDMQAVSTYTTVTNFNKPGPIRASICDLEQNPSVYNRKQLEISGFVALGFEKSVLFDPVCSSKLSIWVESGGKTRIGVMYCCNELTERLRKKDLVVEGIMIPLISDDRFKKFDEMLQKPDEPMVRATLIGWFFSGEEMNFPRGESWGGYGHFGMNSLFVIQQVLSLEEHAQEGIDYSTMGIEETLVMGKCGSYSHVEESSFKEALALQSEVDAGKTEWRLSEPMRVASEKLKEIIRDENVPRINLDVVFSSSRRIVYLWRPTRSRSTKYLVLVNRPYWLLLNAKDRKKIIWVISSIVKACT